METEQAYKAREVGKAVSRMAAIDAAPLADRQAGRAEFIEACAYPERIAESAEWIFNGSYGFGEMTLTAERYARCTTALQRRACLMVAVGAFDHGCPSQWINAAWTALSLAQRKALDAALDSVELEVNA